MPGGKTPNGILGPPEWVLEGAHSDVVRAVLWEEGGDGVVGWSGGEDGRVCRWVEEGGGGVGRKGVGDGVAGGGPLKREVDKGSRRQSPY